jgi:hypothetical protein
MVTKKIIYFILAGMFTFSCAICEDYPYDKKALTYKNKFVFDNQFRMDGMYLMYNEKDKYWSLNYFFQNGSYYNVAIDEPNRDYNFFGCKDTQKEKNILYFWGYFIVEDGILKVQAYDPSSMNRYTKYKVKEKWAEIVNDTTIHFFKDIDVEGKSSNIDKTFHFRHCENKPDSTNILMRN